MNGRRMLLLGSLGFAGLMVYFPLQRGWIILSFFLLASPVCVDRVIERLLETRGEEQTKGSRMLAVPLAGLINLTVGIFCSRLQGLGWAWSAGMGVISLIVYDVLQLVYGFVKTRPTSPSVTLH